MAQLIHLALDERGKPRVTIFRRGPSLYARYRIENRAVSDGAPYVTETLKTLDVDDACKAACARLAEIRAAEAARAPLRSATVAHEIDAFVAAYQSALAKGLSGYSPHMLRGFRKTICRYWREYLGHKRLHDVTLQDMERYEEWRLDYWQRWLDARREAESRKHRVHRHDVQLPSGARMHVSRRTLQWEINAFKQFLGWAAKRGRYRGDAQLYGFKKGATSRRSAFTQAEYDRLQGVINDEAWLKDAGKHGHDRRLARYREMLRAYVLFLANTGMRVGEARRLRWSEVSFERTQGNGTICKVWVSQSFSKVGKRREVIGNAIAADAVQRLHEARNVRSDFCEADDFIWCGESGRVIGDFREGFNNVLKLAAAELDPDGCKHTLYSLRHHYITERLRQGVGIYELASNCGTSVAMIERYYSDARSGDFVHSLTVLGQGLECPSRVDTPARRDIKFTGRSRNGDAS